MFGDSSQPLRPASAEIFTPIISLLPQARQNPTFESDTGITAELLWTSAMPHEGQQVAN